MILSAPRASLPVRGVFPAGKGGKSVAGRRAAAARAKRWKARRRRAERLGEILLAYVMIAFGLFTIWRCLFDPTFLPDVQPKVRYEDMTLEEFMKLSSTNLNTATRAELIQLPGIGQVLADRIMTYRLQHGGFTSVKELTNIPGIGEATMEQLRNYVYVE